MLSWKVHLRVGFIKTLLSTIHFTQMNNFFPLYLFNRPNPVALLFTFLLINTPVLAFTAIVFEVS